MANLSHLPAAWRKSGLTQQAFCDQEGISLATFSYWRGKELRGELRSIEAPQSDPPEFTEVRLQQVLTDERPPAIEITLADGTHVRIPMSIRC